jgi:predicted phage terminase large subunit-like protein
MPTERQLSFLELDCEEAFYGGAVGGGKSDCLLMAALQYVEAPKYRALLLRRTFADLSLPDALMYRADEWLRPTGARWHDKLKTWVFPSGATLTFGYMQTENDKFRYKGPGFQFVGWDELTEFTESMYRYMFSRMRRLSGSVVPLRMRGASNPDGIGHAWVKQRFIEDGESAGRVFVPARLRDNPYLDADSYEKTLQNLDPVTRRQLLEGDWDVRPEGKLFKREWFALIDAGPATGRSVRFWDLAATETGDHSVGCKMRRAGNEYVIEDVVRGRWTPSARDQVILQTAQLDGRAVEIVIEQEPGSAGVSQIATLVQLLAGFRVSGKRSTGDKITRAGPLASQMEAGNVKIVNGVFVSELIDELVSFPSAGIHDDQVDAASGCFLVLAEPALNPLLGLLSHAGAKGWVAKS